MKTSNPDFFVVGIGASAGGLDAIQILFDNLPADTGLAFVIVQHLSPTFKSLMDELLAKHTNMPIELAADGIELMPNHIYLNPKEKNIVCRDGRIQHLDKDHSYPLNLPIDIFFHSLGNDLEHKSIGIILSGTGTDGSRGISTIKESGGTVIVQEPSSAQFDGMPVTAINSQLADYILSPDKIGEELVRLAASPKFFFKENENNQLSNEDYFNKIIETINKYSGIEFSLYKPNTIIRRIEKRINIKQLSSIEDYYDLISTNEQEQKILLHECLIGVTSFFRDTEAFEIFRDLLLKEIFSNKENRKTFRFWCIGCSTGEEAYSLAMNIDEYLAQHNMVLDYKIFATDANLNSIQIASAGIYPVNLVTDVSKERLEKYFLKTGNQFEVIKRIREKIVFSTHDILKDPPFIRMDFISCRNMLIYMNNKSQRKIINTIQFSLNLKGYLLLGNSENISDIKDRFEVVNSKWRIYRNISENRSYSSIFPENKLYSYNVKFPFIVENTQAQSRRSMPEHIFNKNIAEFFGPTCIYLDSQLNILFLNGDISNYLTFGRGMLKK
jgi:two-component system, chemotaxis family, CheB/CheR fusion protein